VESLRSAVKRPPPKSAPKPPWSLDDDAAARDLATQRMQPRAVKPGEEAYRYSRGGLPSSWGRMGATPPAGGVDNAEFRVVKPYAPPTGTPVDEKALRQHMELKRAGSSAAAPSSRGGRPPTGASPVPPSRGGTATRGGTAAANRGGTAGSSRGRPTTSAYGGVNLSDDTTEAGPHSHPSSLTSSTSFGLSHLDASYILEDAQLSWKANEHSYTSSLFSST